MIYLHVSIRLQEKIRNLQITSGPYFDAEDFLAHFKVCLSLVAGTNTKRSWKLCPVFHGRAYRSTSGADGRSN
jgi:hypothetical protein